MFSHFLLMLLWTSVVQVLSSNQSRGNVSIAMVGGVQQQGHDRRSTLAHKQALHFFETIFSNHRDMITSRRMWHLIKADNCPGIKPAQDRNPPHQRGCALAHRQTWDEFLFENRQLATKLPMPTAKVDAATLQEIAAQPKLVVFEDDVMEIDPRAPDFAFESIINMTTHLLYLGWCFDKEPGVRPPLCAHAYALTLQGARILLQPGNMDWCLRTNGQAHGNVDDQLSKLAHAHDETGLTWAVAGRPWGQSTAPVFGFNDSSIRKRALVEGFNLGLIERWEGGEGGLFHQIKYEEKARFDVKEGGVYQIKWPSTTVYLYQNASFHAFPNVRTFAKMGFDFQVTPVQVIARSQVLSAMGATLPDLP